MTYFYNELKIRRILGGTDRNDYTDHQRIEMGTCNQYYHENLPIAENNLRLVNTLKKSGVLYKCEKFDIGSWKGNVYVCFTLKDGMALDDDGYRMLKNYLQYDWCDSDEVRLQRVENGKWDYKYEPSKGEYRYNLHFSGDGTIDILTMVDVLLNGVMFNKNK